MKTLIIYENQLSDTWEILFVHGKRRRTYENIYHKLIHRKT